MKSDKLRGQRILVVEDDIVLRMVLAGHLRDLGGRVDEAGSMAEARRAFQVRKYQVMVSDIHLPDGIMLELAHEVRARQPELQFIFITGDEDRALFDEALQDHPAGYLIKPFELMELDAVLIKSLDAANELPSEPVRRFTEDIDEGDVAQALESLGAQRIVLRTTAPTMRRPPFRLYAKLIGAALAVILFGFGVGYLLHDPTPSISNDDGPNIIYVPVAPETATSE